MRLRVLDVQLPAGPQYCWDRAREFGEAGFTANDLYMTTRGVPRSTVRSWLERMVKLEAIAIVGVELHGDRNPTHRYAVVKPSAKPPLDLERGYGQVQQNLWTAMRALPAFTISEIAAVASTDTVEVTRNAAQKWVDRLAAAGVVIAVRPSKGSRRDSAVWKLRAAYNTGPLAPQRYQAAFLYDPNQQAVIGVPEAEEIRS